MMIAVLPSVLVVKEDQPMRTRISAAITTVIALAIVVVTSQGAQAFTMPHALTMPHV
jgi:hypothetical protein